MLLVVLFLLHWWFTHFWGPVKNHGEPVMFVFSDREFLALDGMIMAYNNTLD